jgi:hypothetical protein
LGPVFLAGLAMALGLDDQAGDRETEETPVTLHGGAAERGR